MRTNGRMKQRRKPKSLEKDRYGRWHSTASGLSRKVSASPEGFRASFIGVGYSRSLVKLPPVMRLACCVATARSFIYEDAWNIAYTNEAPFARRSFGALNSPAVQRTDGEPHSPARGPRALQTPGTLAPAFMPSEGMVLNGRPFPSAAEARADKLRLASLRESTKRVAACCRESLGVVRRLMPTGRETLVPEALDSCSIVATHAMERLAGSLSILGFHVRLKCLGIHVTANAPEIRHPLHRVPTSVMPARRACHLPPDAMSPSARTAVSPRLRGRAASTWATSGLLQQPPPCRRRATKLSRARRSTA